MFVNQDGVNYNGTSVVSAIIHCSVSTGSETVQVSATFATTERGLERLSAGENRRRAREAP